MTKEQAIQNLRDIKNLYTWSTGADDALDMAIKALREQQDITIEWDIDAKYFHDENSASFCPTCGKRILKQGELI